MTPGFDASNIEGAFPLLPGPQGKLPVQGVFTAYAGYVLLHDLVLKDSLPPRITPSVSHPAP